MNIVNFFKFVFIAIGHPSVFFVYLYIWYKIEVLPISGYIIQPPTRAFVLFLLFALLFYAGWLVMLTCIFKIIKPKLNVESFLNVKLDFPPAIVSFFGYFNILVFCVF